MTKFVINFEVNPNKLLSHFLVLELFFFSHRCSILDEHWIAQHLSKKIRENLQNPRVSA
jgi:hypothetical protein